MGDVYQIEFPIELYDRFVGGKGRYLILINLPKRKVYKEGNILTIVKKDQDNNHLESLKVKIDNILYFTTLKELVEMVGKDKIGYTPSVSSDKIEDIYNKFNKNADIEKYGLMAVHFSYEK